MADNPPEIGKVIQDHKKAFRDAIHVAVAPVQAAHRLWPGWHVGLRDGKATDLMEMAERIGIVDPFLDGSVEPDDWFWLFLYPGSITGLRHVWSHPAFRVLHVPSP